MLQDGYFDIRDLAAPPVPLGDCPVVGCKAALGKAPSQWGELPYCPVHQLRIHSRSNTFVYYNGPDATSQRAAALRNIVFEPSYFRAHVLGNAAKAETHRISHETSEDALTWNVFAELSRAGRLAHLLQLWCDETLPSEPELYLWGLRIRLGEDTPVEQFPPLLRARDEFEKGVTRFLTEPDIMLYVPGRLLVLVEAKLTSGNTVAGSDNGRDVAGDKPRSREGIVHRYSRDRLPEGSLLPATNTAPFYSQLYRNLVFAIHMAHQLGVQWGLVNLVSDNQCRKRTGPEYQDPTPFVEGLLPPKVADRFRRYTWEELYLDHAKPVGSLARLAEYMLNKSANGDRAFSI